MKFTVNQIEKIHEYIKLWYDSDSWRAFNMAWDSGYTELACSMISEVIDPEHCFEYAKPIETLIIKLLKGYSKKALEADRKACFDNAEVWVNKNTNEHAFIRNSDVDYLVDASEMRNLGYVTSEKYYEAM